MESRTKTPVTAEQAAAIVDRHLPGTALVEFTECTEGWFNAVHRLRLDDGRALVLKIAPPADVPVLRYEHDIITTEVEALRTVAAHTSAPVPDIVAWDPTGEVLPSPYILMTACPGLLLQSTRGSLPADASQRIDDQILGLLAEINTITGPHFGRPAPTAPRHARWSDAFAALVDDLLADAADAGVDLPVAHDEIRTIVQAHQASLDEASTPKMVHWDLWDPNVFIDAHTQRVTGIIDFERVLWADPLIEAQFTGARTMGHRTAAYGFDLFAAPGAAARRRLYDLYLYLVMTIECAYRNYDTDDIENLARPMLTATLDEIRTT